MNVAPSLFTAAYSHRVRFWIKIRVRVQCEYPVRVTVRILMKNTGSEVIKL